ncbi:MAG: methyltransferase domain-containing protein [Planctomycetes bacterium]|nr:methyltransferase domain-containing protein [Planctomycetota bacterium]
MDRSRDIECEFGVPFPGRILPREQWTRTGLRVAGGPFDWERVFGRAAPRVVDLGCGNGRFLIASALARPHCDHLGIDLVQVAVDYAAQRANRRGLPNVRFVVGDAGEWMCDRLGADSVDEVHVYHPQPYYEPDASARRLLTPPFLERAWTVVRRGGLLVLQTDNRAYWQYLLRAAGKYFEPDVLPGPWPDAPLGRTRREIQARQKGLVVWRMQARRRDLPLDVFVPQPDFDANRPRFRRTKGRSR